MTKLYWRKSQASDTSNCLEAASSTDHVFVRDSKTPVSTGSVLSFHGMAWEMFHQRLRT